MNELEIVEIGEFSCFGVGVRVGVGIWGVVGVVAIIGKVLGEFSGDFGYDRG